MTAPSQRDGNDGTATFSDGIASNAMIGLAVVFLLVGALGGWAATARLSGAVVASGTVVVDSNVKKVQHPAGGVVGEILVRDGQRVAAGDLVLRLDETVTRANLGVIMRQLDELSVRAARLETERDGADGFAIPATLQNRDGEPLIVRMLAGERTLLESRRTARERQKSQLRERILQLGQEITGLTAQQEAKTREIELIEKELAGLTQLYSKNLVSTTKYTATQREAARLKGEQGNIIASIAQARGRIAETELQIIGIDQDLRSEVMRELREVQAKDAELSERRIAAEDMLRRIDIRAPIGGIVHQLSVHTVGGVVNAGEALMLIVPENEALVLEARIPPQDIDQIGLDQPAYVRFTTFNQRTTPELNGKVARVSADLTREPQTGLAYYVARIALSENELKRLGTSKLVPGMPAEVYIATTERTALSYILKPLTDQFARIGRER